ncbi:unnamed protein product [Symbiodinium sp. CCMP2456]|nr:unnamed protein product [Symbiodinium sp. CCMP2456]
MAAVAPDKASESFLRTLKVNQVATAFYGFFKQPNNRRLEGGPNVENIQEHLVKEYKALGEPAKNMHVLEIVKNTEVELSRNLSFEIHQDKNSQWITEGRNSIWLPELTGGKWKDTILKDRNTFVPFAQHENGEVRPCISFFQNDDDYTARPKTVSEAIACPDLVSMKDEAPKPPSTPGAMPLRGMRGTGPAPPPPPEDSSEKIDPPAYPQTLNGYCMDKGLDQVFVHPEDDVWDIRVLPGDCDDWCLYEKEETHKLYAASASGQPDVKPIWIAKLFKLKSPNDVEHAQKLKAEQEKKELLQKQQKEAEEDERDNERLEKYRSILAADMKKTMEAELEGFKVQLEKEAKLKLAADQEALKEAYERKLQGTAGEGNDLEKTNPEEAGVIAAPAEPADPKPAADQKEEVTSSPVKKDEQAPPDDKKAEFLKKMNAAAKPDAAAKKEATPASRKAQKVTPPKCNQSAFSRCCSLPFVRGWPHPFPFQGRGPAPIGAHWAPFGPIGPHRGAPNGPQWGPMGPNGRQWAPMGANGRQWAGPHPPL